MQTPWEKSSSAGYNTVDDVVDHHQASQTSKLDFANGGKLQQQNDDFDHDKDPKIWKQTVISERSQQQTTSGRERIGVAVQQNQPLQQQYLQQQQQYEQQHHELPTWYHPHLTKQEAKTLLMTKPIGTFLLRDSLAPQVAYTISFRSRTQVLHVRIYRTTIDPKMYYMDAPVSKRQQFATLHDLATYCINLENGIKAFDLNGSKNVDDSFVLIEPLEYLPRGEIHPATGSRKLMNDIL